MNDAGWDHPLAGPETGLISWFQVEASAVADDRPLPVRPFLRCAEDATARIGTLALSSVQLLIPVQGIDVSSRPRYAPVPSMMTLYWFARSNPDSATQVEILLDSGQDPSVPAVASDLADTLNRLRQNVFVVRSVDDVGQQVELAALIDAHLWHGPRRYGATLRGELAEWSCGAIGWVAEVIADSLAQMGLQSPLLLGVKRI